MIHKWVVVHLCTVKDKRFFLVLSNDYLHLPKHNERLASKHILVVGKSEYNEALC